jgi:LPXTG-motif cell wall-anchored protein
MRDATRDETADRGRVQGLSRRRAEQSATKLTEYVLRRIPSEEDRRAFVGQRYAERLTMHTYMAPRHSAIAMALTVIAVGGGAATSTLAATGDTESRWLIALGLLIAFTGAVNQVGRFGQRAAARFQAGNALRKEGWDFALRQGRYARLDDETAFSTFYAMVWTIEQPADALAEAPPEGTG